MSDDVLRPLQQQATLVNCSRMYIQVHHFPMFAATYPFPFLAHAITGRISGQEMNHLETSCLAIASRSLENVLSSRTDVGSSEIDISLIALTQVRYNMLRSINLDSRYRL